MASRIEDYGLIGNTYTSALVSRRVLIQTLASRHFWAMTSTAVGRYLRLWQYATADRITEMKP
jgi:hypothetical protein